MTTTTSSPTTAIAVTEPAFTGQEQLALTGFLAGYTGLTREAYTLDLRQYANWCQQHHLRLFAARRADIECFARDLEANGRARATVTRRLCTIAGFYKYAVEEDLLDHSPAAHVRRPAGRTTGSAGGPQSASRATHLSLGRGACLPSVIAAARCYRQGMAYPLNAAQAHLGKRATQWPWMTLMPPSTRSTPRHGRELGFAVGRKARSMTLASAASRRISGAAESRR